MSDIPKDFPRPYAIKRFVQPKLIPQAPGARALAALHDNLLRWRRKLVFQGGGQVIDILDSQDVLTGDFTAHRFYCRSGIAARALIFRLGLARPNWPNGGDDPTPTNPRIEITVHGLNGPYTDLYTVSAGLGTGGTSTDNPDEWAWPQVVAEVVAGDTIDVQIDVKEGARLFAVSCYEVSEDDTSFRLDELYVSDGSPILDNQRQNLAVNIGGAFLYNGAHLVNFTTPSFNEKVQFANTYANIFDTSLTTVTANTPGYKVETTYHNSVARATVAVKMAVYGRCSSGTGKVRFADSGGTLIEVTGIGTTLQWYTATGTFPAGTTKADIQIAGSGVANVRVLAVSLFELD